MAEGPVYYEPPAEHERHIRGLVRFLIAFFSLLVIVAAGIVVNAQWLATKLPFSAEQRFVQPFERFFSSLADEPPTAMDQVVEEYLQMLADDLARGMDVPPDYEITVHYLASDEMNAFATFGGHLFVLSGLVAGLPDENSLAMVLAHEIAHIKHRDPVASLGRGMAIQMVYGFLTGRSSGSADIAAYGGNIGLMYFSREQERAADLAALGALQSKYGHVAGSETLFTTLARASEDDASELPNWLSTHPQLEARIQDLAAYAEAQGWPNGTPRPLPPRILEALAERRPDATP